MAVDKAPSAANPEQNLALNTLPVQNGQTLIAGQANEGQVSQPVQQNAGETITA
jgi:hypothetical protein